jgi:hypothetical protein
LDRVRWHHIAVGNPRALINSDLPQVLLRPKRNLIWRRGRCSMDVLQDASMSRTAVSRGAAEWGTGIIERLKAQLASLVGNSSPADGDGRP